MTMQMIAPHFTGLRCGCCGEGCQRGIDVWECIYRGQREELIICYWCAARIAADWVRAGGALLLPTDLCRETIRAGE